MLNNVFKHLSHNLNFSFELESINGDIGFHHLRKT